MCVYVCVCVCVCSDHVLLLDGNYFSASLPVLLRGCAVLGSGHRAESTQFAGFLELPGIR